MAPPKGKGKDLSRMSAPGPSPVSIPALGSSSTTASHPASAGGAAAPRVPSPRSIGSGSKPKGKDFSRMAGPPSSHQPTPAALSASQPLMPVVTSHPKTMNPTADLAVDIRRHNAARMAAGMSPLPPSNMAAAVIAQQSHVGRPPNSQGAPEKGNQHPSTVQVTNRRPSNHQSTAPPQVQLPQTSYVQPHQAHHQPLIPNAPQHFKQPAQVQKQAQKKKQNQPLSRVAQQQRGTASKNTASTQPRNKDIPQPTQRPSWSEAHLSTPEGIPPLSVAKNPSDGYGKPSMAPILGEKLQSLCRSVDPSYSLDSEVQERLVEMADSFVERVTRNAVRLAKHRGSKSLDVVDVAVALKKGYNMEVPGLGPPSVAGTGAQGARDGVMGGWIFAEKANPGMKEHPKKKPKLSGAAAAAAAM